MRIVVWRVCLSLAAVVLWLIAEPTLGAPSLRGSVEDAARALLADLFSERPAGELLSADRPDELLARFLGAAPPLDAEYLILRPGTPASLGFARMIGVARITEARGEVVRARVIWADEEVRPGDRLLWPSRIALILLPTTTIDLAESTARADRIDQWLELALVADRRVRILRADRPPAEPLRAEQLRREREYGLVVAPLLVRRDDGIEVVLLVRSAFTGQTLAKRQAVWAPASSEGRTVIAPPPSAPTVAAGRQAQGAPGPSPPRYGPAIRPEQNRGGIEVVERSADYARVPLPHAVNALLPADLDGDGVAEIAGITEQQVIVYRRRGHDLETLTAGPALPVFTAYLHIDAADVDGDGREELVVTTVRSVPRGTSIENTLASRILRLKDDRLVPMGSDLDLHLGVLRAPGSPPVILAQRLGRHELAEGPVARLEWRDGRYREADPAGLPPHLTSVYGFAAGDLDGDGRVELALVDAAGRLRLHDETGPRGEAAEEDLGPAGVLGVAQTPRFPDYRGLPFDAKAEQLAVWHPLPQRVLITAAGPVPEIITLSNPRRTGFRLRDGDGLPGRIVGFRWDPERRGLVKQWESTELAGAALDVAVTEAGGSGPVELLALSGTTSRRWLEIFTLYRRSALRRQPGPAESGKEP